MLAQADRAKPRASWTQREQVAQAAAAGRVLGLGRDAQRLLGLAAQPEERSGPKRARVPDRLAGVLRELAALLGAGERALPVAELDAVERAAW